MRFPFLFNGNESARGGKKDGEVWPRHGRVGAERPGFCGAKDRALAGPGTPVAKEWPGKGIEEILFYRRK